MESRVSSRRGLSLTTNLLLIALLVLCVAATGVAQKNLVYINGNVGLCPTCQANRNVIYAFVNDGAGNLTPVPGQPFRTGGTGIYQASPDLPFLADNQILINPEGTLLFAVNGHSNSIAVFKINSDGSLTAASGSPFASNGPQPTSLALLDNPTGGLSVLVAANGDNDPDQAQTNPNYSLFSVASSGSMQLNANATVNLPAGSSPSQVLIRNNAKLLFGMQHLGAGGQALLSSYRIQLSGGLSPVNSLTPPGGSQFLGAVLHPVQLALYTGLPDVNEVGVYQYGIQNGQLFFKRTVPNDGNGIGWMTTNKGGTRLYTSETDSNTVSAYSLNVFLGPREVQHLTVSAGGAFGPTSIAMDPTDKFLYVLKGNSLHILSVDQFGSLSESLPARALGAPAGTVSTGIATLMK